MPLPLVEDFDDLSSWVSACINDPDFRVLPSSGVISMSMVNTELGRPAANGISLNDAAVRNMASEVLAHSYNVAIGISQLRGRQATQLAATRVLCIGTGINGANLTQGIVCSYNFRTGTLYVGGGVYGQGQAAGADITSGNYNVAGLIVTGAEFKFTWNGNWYTVPVTQYPSAANDWTGIFTIDGGFVTGGGNSWIPHTYGGLKIG